MVNLIDGTNRDNPNVVQPSESTKKSTPVAEAVIETPENRFNRWYNKIAKTNKYNNGFYISQGEINGIMIFEIDEKTHKIIIKSINDRWDPIKLGINDNKNFTVNNAKDSDNSKIIASIRKYFEEYDKFQEKVESSVLVSRARQVFNREDKKGKIIEKETVGTIEIEIVDGITFCYNRYSGKFFLYGRTHFQLDDEGTAKILGRLESSSDIKEEDLPNNPMKV